jgi:hypothetical protein
VQNEKAHKHSHHRFDRINRLSPRDGFNGFLRALPGDRAFLSPSQATMREHCRQLDAGVEASGPHDFTVRLKARRLRASLRPSHPAPNVRDDREAPLLEERGTAETSGVDLPDIARRKFSTETLDKLALREAGI